MARLVFDYATLRGDRVTMDRAVFDYETLRRPSSEETYSDYLGSFRFFNNSGFIYRELVRQGDPRHGYPPRELWARMVPTFLLAWQLRERMLCHGATGLAVRAAYRPTGGERDSQHKVNAALDLDLLAADLERDPGLAAAYARAAAELWREHKHMRVGVGTYAAEGHETTRRVHLDSLYRHRCWQGTGTDENGKATFSARPAVLRLAKIEETDPDYLACIATGEIDEPEVG
jgi:hypothetical protein